MQTGCAFVKIYSKPMFKRVFFFSSFRVFLPFFLNHLRSFVCLSSLELQHAHTHLPLGNNLLFASSRESQAPIWNMSNSSSKKWKNNMCRALCVLQEQECLYEQSSHTANWAHAFVKTKCLNIKCNVPSFTIKDILSCKN